LRLPRHALAAGGLVRRTVRHRVPPGRLRLLARAWLAAGRRPGPLHRDGALHLLSALVAHRGLHGRHGRPDRDRARTGARNRAQEHRLTRARAATTGGRALEGGSMDSNSNDFPAWHLVSRYDAVPDLPVLAEVDVLVVGGDRKIGRAHV